MDLFSATKPPLIELDDQGSLVQYFPSVFSLEESQTFFEALSSQIDWRQEQISIYGKQHDMPRLTAFYGDAGLCYTYSGFTSQTQPWTQTLTTLKEKAEALAATHFNSVLLNLYRDGQDSMGWHSDDEPELGENPIIASFSFGAVRNFNLRNKVNHLSRYQIALESGSVLIMSGATQRYWQHHITKSTKALEPRINLTFRTINA